MWNFLNNVHAKFHLIWNNLHVSVNRVGVKTPISDHRIHSTFHLSGSVVLMILRNFTVVGCLCYVFVSCILASFTADNKIMRHFRVRKFHQKTYAFCNCYGWANMLVITQYFFYRAKKRKNPSDLPKCLSWIVNVGTLSVLHVLAYFCPKKISLSV